MSIKNYLLSLFMIMLPLFSNAQESDFNFIPKPQEVNAKEGKFTINDKTVIYYDYAFNGEYLKKIIDKATGYSVVCKDAKKAGNLCCNYIFIDTDNSYDIPQEGYELKVGPKGVTIKASSQKGSFYAIQTLLQMLHLPQVPQYLRRQTHPRYGPPGVVRIHERYSGLLRFIE